MSAKVLRDVRREFYLDSVALMRLSREIGALPGVERAALMMGSPSNLAIMQDAGLVDETAIARPNDLVIALRASSEEAGRIALDAARKALDEPKVSARGEERWRPRSIAAAVQANPGANLALISVPGDFAVAEARKALRRGLHVMMFSDNVTIEDERSLKEEARSLGLFMMGPDCGTAILGGVPLAFANRVNRGAIGIVGASGTGTQEVSSLISEAGEGISHAIGVGGRDLKPEIGGLMTLMAIDALDRDPATRHVVLVSKPPSRDVAQAVIGRIGRSEKTFTVCFIGGAAIDLPVNATLARTLEEAAAHAIGRALPEATEELVASALRVGRIEGFYSGGTLCAEAQVILAAGGREVTSNAAIPGVRDLSNAGNGSCDRVIDLGADQFTRGRPHPMIDPTIRDNELLSALTDPGVASILIDVVIGYGAHADPAGHLAGVLANRGPKAPAIVASVTGTELDPQVRSRQIARLRQSGVIVARSNARASELALRIASGRA